MTDSSTTKKIQNGVKEWISVIDAMGSGKQTVLVRTYPPNAEDYLLVPTLNYYKQASPEKFDAYFQPAFVQSARNAAEKTTQKATAQSVIDINFYSHVDSVYKLPELASIASLLKFFICSENHVQEYLSAAGAEKSCYLWLMRTHRLAKPQSMTVTGKGSISAYYRHPYSISLQGATPVIGNVMFASIKRDIEQCIAEFAPT